MEYRCEITVKLYLLKKESLVRIAKQFEEAKKKEDRLKDQLNRQQDTTDQRVWVSGASLLLQFQGVFSTDQQLTLGRVFSTGKDVVLGLFWNELALKGPL